MRSQVKSWDNRKELRGKGGRYNGWTRRVTWYEGPDPSDIRLRFEDLEGMTNRFYKTKEAAQADYDSFRNGATTASFRN
jgi:hypothetical protein